jgi:hypothetical protein
VRDYLGYTTLQRAVMAGKDDVAQYLLANSK